MLVVVVVAHKVDTAATQVALEALAVVVVEAVVEAGHLHL